MLILSSPNASPMLLLLKYPQQWSTVVLHWVSSYLDYNPLILIPPGSCHHCCSSLNSLMLLSKRLQWSVAPCGPDAMVG